MLFRNDNRPSLVHVRSNRRHNNRRLDYGDGHRRRRNDDHWVRHGNYRMHDGNRRMRGDWRMHSNWRLGDHGHHGRMTGDSGFWRGWSDNRRRGPGLRNNPARRRMRRCHWRCRNHDGRFCNDHGLDRCGRSCRHAKMARLFFLFLLLGQNSLQHIAGLGDMREVNFRNDVLLAITGGRGR
jgi:hypothetical protein